MPADELFSIDEAAAYLRVSRSTLCRYIRSGRLAGERIGPRLVRIRRSSLELIGEPVRVAQ